MVVGAKVCELTEDLLWFVCVFYVGLLTSPRSKYQKFPSRGKLWFINITRYFAHSSQTTRARCQGSGRWSPVYL